MSTCTDPSFDLSDRIAAMSIDTYLTDRNRTVESDCTSCAQTRCGTSVSPVLHQLASVYVSNSNVNIISSNGTIDCAVEWCTQSSCSNLCYSSHIQYRHPNYSMMRCVVCREEFGFDSITDALTQKHAGNGAHEIGCCSRRCRAKRVWQFGEVHPADFYFGRLYAQIELFKYAIANGRGDDDGEVYEQYVTALSLMMTRPGYDVTYKCSTSMYAAFLIAYPHYRKTLSLFLPESPDYTTFGGNSVYFEHLYKSTAITIVDVATYIGETSSKLVRFAKVYTPSVSLTGVHVALVRNMLVLQRALDHSMVSPTRLRSEWLSIVQDDKRNKEQYTLLHDKMHEARSAGGAMTEVQLSWYLRQSETILVNIDQAWRDPSMCEAMVVRTPMWLYTDPKWIPTNVMCSECHAIFSIIEAHMYEDWNFDDRKSALCTNSEHGVCAALTFLCADNLCHARHAQRFHSAAIVVV